MSLNTFKLLRFLQSQPLEATERMTISPATRIEAEHLLRAYLRRMLERDLKSVAFLDEVGQAMRAQPSASVARSSQKE